MNLFQVIILSLVEGFTEFLPISSTGHLLLVQQIFKWEVPFSFDLFIQLGAYSAALIYFFPRIKTIYKSLLKLSQKKKLKSTDKDNIRLGEFIIYSSIPTIVLFFLLNDKIETYLHKTLVISINLIVVGILMILVERFSKHKKTIKDVSLKDTLILGTLQSLAIIPGISRSGSIITGGLALNYKRQDITELSFLLGIPVILGAGFKSLLDLMENIDFFKENLLLLVIGFTISFITGYFSIKMLLRFVQNRSLEVFGIYRIIVGFILVLLSL